MRSRLLVAVMLVILMPLAASAPGATPSDLILGRWDVTLQTADGPSPSWFELIEDRHGLDLRYVGFWGAPQEVGRLQWADDELAFSLDDPRGPWRDFRAHFNGHWFAGTARDGRGHVVPWTAVRAPLQARRHPVRWGRPITLFDGHDLDGWHPRHAGSPAGWTVRDGRLCSLGVDDLVSTRRFRDFKLHVECRVPEGGDSGIHLRGRYEIQVRPQAEHEAWAGTHASLYGFVPARGVHSRMPDQDDVFDITLIGRTLTVDLDGVRVIDEAEVPGITGDALDSDEGAPGPLMLQGRLGPVSFTRIVLTPAR